MTRSTRNLFLLVGTVSILSLVLFAVGPVLAQDGSGGQSGQSGQSGQTGQGGNTIVISSSDTLGTLVSRYNLSGTNLRDFLSMNTDLPLVPGQRVVFPAGLSVNIPTTGQGTGSGQGQVATGTATTVPLATLAATATTVATTAPVATLAATTVPTTAAAFTSTPFATATAATLATTPAATTAAGSVLETGTPAATLAATTAPVATLAATATTVATTAPVATLAATTAPLATLAATTVPTTAAAFTSTPFATATTAGGATTGGPTDAQLLQFVRSNSGLRFGLTVALPPGIPATGGTGQGVPGTAGTPAAIGPGVTTGAGTTVTNQFGSLSGAAASNAACSSDPPPGYGYYKVMRGDSLQSISDKFGVDIATIISLNPGSAFAKGNVLLLPGVEAPGAWNLGALCPESGEPSR